MYKYEVGQRVIYDKNSASEYVYKGRSGQIFAEIASDFYTGKYSFLVEIEHLSPKYVPGQCVIDKRGAVHILEKFVDGFWMVHGGGVVGEPAITPYFKAGDKVRVTNNSDIFTLRERNSYDASWKVNEIPGSIYEKCFQKIDTSGPYSQKLDAQSIKDWSLAEIYTPRVPDKLIPVTTRVQHELVPGKYGAVTISQSGSINIKSDEISADTLEKAAELLKEIAKCLK